MTFNIDDLTIRQIKQIQAMASGVTASPQLSSLIGKKCIIRTYTAGVHYGEIVEKSGTEVIVKNSRRLWQWKAKESISLSAVAKFGIDQSGSKICAPVDSIWLDAIELIPCTDDAIKSIEGAEIVKAS